MTPSPFLPLVRIHGTELRAAGEPFRARGLNYGNWMMVESYMIGLPWSEYQMRAEWRRRLGEEAYRAFWGTYMEAYCGASDIAFIAAQGFNTIQLPFNYRHFDSDGTCAGFDGDGFAHIDRLLDLCSHHGIRVLLSMHCVPGVMARDWNAESAWGEVGFWDHPEFLERTCALWRKIAARYRGDGRVLGYEPLNEPVAPDNAVFQKVNERLVAAIRAVDPDHIIFVSNNKWGKEAASLHDALFADPQVAPVLHHYTAAIAPWDAMPDFPCVIDGVTYDEQALVATLDKAQDHARIRRPHFVGELGVASSSLTMNPERQSPEAVHLKINDALLGWLNREGFHWTFWAYKDLGVIGVLAPKADTPWRQFLDRADVKQLIDGYSAPANTFRQSIAQALPELTAGEDLDLFIYQCRHHWDALVLGHVLEKLKAYSLHDLEAMARSFAFEHCEVNAPKLAIYRKHA